MTPRNSLFRRLRAYIKVLNVPAASHPQIAKAAEEVGKPVVLMTGVLWASYLAAYVSASDEALKNNFSIILTVALWLFVSSTVLQIAHASHAKTALENALYWLCYIGLGAVSTFLLTYSGGVLSGFQDFKTSARQAQYDKINKCLADQSRQLRRFEADLSEADAAYSACRNVANSDVSALNLALAEQRISKQQWAALAVEPMNRCHTGDLGTLGKEIEKIAKTDCDPQHFLTH